MVSDRLQPSLPLFTRSIWGHIKLSIIVLSLCLGFYWHCSPSPQEKEMPPTIADSAATIQLGKYLFFDHRLSINHTKSCSTCHAPQFAFSDGYRKSQGAFADVQQRNSPSLINTKHYYILNWANPDIASFVQQMQKPLFSQHPPEMGMMPNNSLLQPIADDSLYAPLFAQAFSTQTSQELYTWANVIAAIAAYCQTLSAEQSPYDRQTMNLSAQRGEKVFQKIGCQRCHTGKYFTSAADSTATTSQRYYNIGLYCLDSLGSYPPSDEGLFQITQNPSDKGKFRVPTLRNLLLTAPYMHDGSVQTLDEVIAIFEQGGRHITQGISMGDGRKNPNKSPMLQPFTLSPQERLDLLSFLTALTDSTILTNPHFQNPIAVP